MNQLGYGGYVWSSDRAESTDSWAAGKLALAAGAGVGLFAAATRMPGAVDTLSAASRFGGNLSPFQLLNTFRVPEVLSPWTSLGYKARGNVDELGFGVRGGAYEWSSEFLKSDSTYDWIKYSTGLDDTALEKAGLYRGLPENNPRTANKLLWEPRKGAAHRGTLSTLIGNTKYRLSDDIALIATNEEVTSLLSGKQGLNRYMSGVLAAGDMYNSHNFSDSSFFTKTVMDGGKTSVKRAGFAIAPSVTGEVGSLGALQRRTTLARGYAAFEMNRFNQLLGDVTEQFGGQFGKDVFNKILGVSPQMKPGPASGMFFRFGGRAALAGGALIGLSQVDWVRRNFSLPGDVLASAAVSAGLAWGARKLSAKPSTGLAIGVASFFGQMILPGFDQGVIPGLATTAVNADIYGRGNAFNPFAHVRRTIEGALPGATSWETGALLAVGGMVAAGTKFGGKRVPVLLANTDLPSKLGMRLSVDDVVTSTDSARDIFWRSMAALEGSGQPADSMRQRARIMDSLRKQQGSLDLLQTANAKWEAAEEAIKTRAEKNPLNSLMLERLESINQKYSAGGLTAWMQKQTRGFATQALYGFFGANVAADKATAESIISMGFKGPTGRLGRLATVGAFIFGAHQFFTGGLLGSTDTSQRLSDIYHGRELVEVKKGRFWEAGGTPFEGSRTGYFRPHAYHLMMTRTREAGVWGPDEDRISPIGKFLRRNFTYNLERRNYYDRPYPVSSAAFSDVPIVGGFLANTIGRLIKPPKLMHVGEWASDDQGFASVYQGARREPAYSLGAAGPGIPQSPFNPGETLAQGIYQFRELEGMTGWAKNVIQGAITGSDLFNTETPILAEAGTMTSWRDRFWEANLGGMLFTNEALRRILPSVPYDKRKVNPITNSMPSWLPDKFHYGDPYKLMEWGEGRLPGAGYSALHPELQNIDPEHYPLIYRYAILADVAPYSQEFRRMKQGVYKRRYNGEMTAREIDFMDAIDMQHAKVMAQYNFDYMHPDAYDVPGFGFLRTGWSGLQRAGRKVVAPFEYMVPMGFRPFQKLVNDRDPIEAYEYERLYGTPMAFWDKPWRDWLRPSIYSTANMLGWQGKPMWRRESDDVGEYFDKLEFLKYMQLADQASAQGQRRDARQYSWLASQTRTGVNPMGNPLSIYWSMPADERKFFNAFAFASGEERRRVEQMVPADHVHLYRAIWSRLDAGDPTLYAGSNTAVNDQYLASQLGEAQNYMQGKPMPGMDWVGWHADVDMEDIKVRYIDSMGKDLHDFGMWESTLKKSMRQPFLNGSTDYLSVGIGTSAIRSDLYNLMGPNGVSPWLQVNGVNGPTTASISYHDDRTPELFSRVSEYLNAY